MSYASRAGRARTNPSSPEAHAICDRCGGRYNHRDLRWQVDWRGTAMQNLRILVCPSCFDDPQEQLRTIRIPPDPVAILNARPQDFVDASTDYRRIEGSTTDPVTGLPIPGTTTRVTEQGDSRGLQAMGVPDDFDQDAVMPLVGNVAYGVALPLLSVSGSGTALVSVTCSAPHGLTTGAQVIAEGLLAAAACGLFTVTVTSATAFTYPLRYTARSVSVSGNLMGVAPRIVTAIVGLPYNTTQVP